MHTTYFSIFCWRFILHVYLYLQALALDQNVVRVTEQTDKTIAALSAEYGKNKEQVIQMLMQVVMQIENPFSKQ